MDGIIFVPYSFDEESPTSVLKRFALGHGCEFPAQLQDFTYMINFFKSELTTASPLVKWIAARAGDHAPRFLEGFYHSLVREGRRGPLEIHGTVIPTKLVRRGSAAYCSECWSERHERYIKDISLMESCPYHHRRYIRACPACNRRLLWISALGGDCMCGHTLVSPTCTESDLYAERALLEIISKKDSAALARLKKLLSQLDYPYASDGDPEEKRAILNAGVGIMNGHEQYVVEYLRYQTQLYPHIPIAYVLAKLPTVSDSAVKEAVERFRMDHASRLGSKGLSADGLPDFNLGRTQLARVAKHSMKELKNLARQFDLPWPKDSARKISHRHFIPLLNKMNRDSRPKSADASGQLTLTINEAAEAAHVSRNTMRHLLHNGFLTEIRGANRTLLISANDVQTFLQRYESASAFSQRLGKSLEQIIELLKKYGLRPINHLKYSGSAVFAREGINNIVNNLTEASPANKKTRYGLSTTDVSTTNTRTGYYTVSSAAEKLGVAYDNIHHYIKTGILTPHRYKKTKYVLLDINEVNQLDVTYLLPAQCGKVLGLNYRLYSRHLVEMGINPVTYDKARECTQPLFLRTDIEKLAKNLREIPPDLVSSHEASQRLKLSHQTVLRLIALGDLAPRYNPTKLTCASLDKVANFKNTHVNGVEASELTNINVKVIRQVLSRFGVDPICVPQKDYSSCLIYRLDELCKHGFRIPCRRSNADTRWSHIKLTELFCVNSLAADLDIPYRSFWSAFIRSGFIPALKINNKFHTTPTDANRCRLVLSHSMTPAMIDQKLNSTGIANYLRRIGLLEIATNLPDNLPLGTFITRDSFEQLDKSEYLVSLPPNTDA